MTTTGAGHAGLVAAAQKGDARARNELVGAYLPLVYNIVGRALGASDDVDDVVQEILLRVVRDLPALRDPESFRSWLVIIAVRQISSYRERQRAATDHLDLVDDADEIAGEGFEDVTILRLHVSDQRRQVAEATRWLEPDYRLLLALWWQENAGQLTRSDLAEAVGLTVAHAGVRLQRMREQLELGRAIVAALAATPRCRDLEAITAGWNGRHTSVWRKRLGRHVRDCAQCAAATSGHVPLERLLLSIAPLAVPVGFAAGLAAKGLLSGAGVGSAPALAAATSPAAASLSAGAAKTSLMAKLAHLTGGHVAGFAASAALVIGATVAYVALPEARNEPPPAAVAAPTEPPRTALPTTAAPSPTSPPTPSAKPSPPAATTSVAPSSPGPAVPHGSWSLEAVAVAGQYLSSTATYAALAPVTASSGLPTRQQATFTVGQGLADASCVTLRAADGRYLRHQDLRMRLSDADSTELFRKDATFCVVAGSAPGSVSLRTFNYPALLIRSRDGGLYVDPGDGSPQYRAESSFFLRSPWAG